MEQEGSLPRPQEPAKFEALRNIS